MNHYSLYKCVFLFKKQLLLLLMMQLCLILRAQLLPDTLQYTHNSGVAGTQWAFTVAQITDIHLGETSANGDYGTIGWNDTIDQNTGCPNTEILRNVVQWINANAISEKIELVLVTGDLSDRGEKSGFIMARRILDSLTVPYVVMNGNHDMWPRISGDEAPVPFGDSVFAEVFSAHFALNSQQFANWDDGTRLNRIFNPLNNIYSQFQNFAFSKGSYRFIVNDFATRYRKPVGVGTNTDAALYDIPGGTYQWLFAAMQQAQPAISDGIILVQHFPLDNETLSSTYSFSSDEFDSVADILEPQAAQFGLCIAGHRHRNKTYNIKRSLLSPTLGVGIETDENAVHPNGMLSLIRLWDYPSAGVPAAEANRMILYPNPFSGKALLKIPATLHQNNCIVEITDTKGRLLSKYETANQSEIEIERQYLKPGIYLLHLKSHYRSEVIKIIVY